MRNILMTVMLIVVVVMIFMNVVAKDTTGTKAMIEQKGTETNTLIGDLISSN